MYLRALEMQWRAVEVTKFQYFQRFAASLPKGRFMSYTTFTPFGQVDVFAAEILR